MPRSSAHAAEARLRFHPSVLPGASLERRAAEALYDAIGRELELNESARRLRHYVQGLHAPVVGAHHVTCSDEAEREAVEAFQRNFVRYCLPSLRFYQKAAFRTANLGGRYEWHSVRIAEQHYALAPGADDWKCLVVKVSAHVSLEEDPAHNLVFGRAARYDAQAQSIYCGAIDALLRGADEPFADELREAFGFEALDRLSVLNDARRVPPAHRFLLAAVASARLQARRAMVDLQDWTPTSPTLYLVVPCVSLNQRNHDTEILCGVYTADRRDGASHDEYFGLGDRPERYRVEVEGRRVRVSDPGLKEPRVARDHRRLVREALAEGATPAASLERSKRNLLEAKTGGALGKLGLGALVTVLAEVAPVPAALVLFGQGLVGIHHVNRAHRLLQEAQGDADARRMLRELTPRLDSLPDEQATHVVELLRSQYALAR